MIEGGGGGSAGNGGVVVVHYLSFFKKESEIFRVNYDSMNGKKQKEKGVVIFLINLGLPRVKSNQLG